MHVFALIPFVAVLVASSFVAVSLVWDSHRRGTGSMTQVFLCICGWALIDLMGQLESDPNQAIFWLKLVHLPALLLSVSVSRLVIEIVPGVAESLRPLARIGLVVALVLGVGATVVPGVVVGATATSWGGWIPQYGIVSIALIPIGCVLPAAAVYQVQRQTRRPKSSPVRQLDRLRSHAVVAAVTISLVAALSTEYVFPLLEIPVPRLGALATVLATATMWLQLLHRSDDLTTAPQGTARAVLEELHDGVALVDANGTILTSNPRLSVIAGQSAASLVGMPLSNLVDVSVETLHSGLEDQECRLETALGDRVPVSITSSGVKNRVGDLNWFVVVLRDLRSVDALRRRLLTSGRLAAVGELAAGIAHEVNNPVAFIRSDLNFLRSRLTEIELSFAKEFGRIAELDLFAEGASRIDRALDGIERVAEVVGDVRGFAHVGAKGTSSGDPEAILESAIRLARLERRHEIEISVEESEFSKYVIAGQDLKQVMLVFVRVLTVNSRQGETVRIHAVADDALLRIDMLGELVDDQAQKEVDRFKMAGEDVLEASADDLGLAMAIELVDELGGAVHVSAPTPLSLRIELYWPFEQEVRE